jgi:hypothetical protein
MKTLPFATKQDLLTALHTGPENFLFDFGAQFSEYNINILLKWDGADSFIDLADDTSIVFIPIYKTGKLLITHNGKDLTILLADGTTHTFTLTGGNATVMLFFAVANGNVHFWLHTDLVTMALPALDEVEPVPVSFTISDAEPSDVVISISERINEALQPVAADFTSALGKTFTPSVAGNTITLTADTPYASGEVERITYAPAVPMQDLSGNEMAAFDSEDFGGVDNNIV